MARRFLKAVVVPGENLKIEAKLGSDVYSAIPIGTLAGNIDADG